MRVLWNTRTIKLGRSANPPQVRSFWALSRPSTCRVKLFASMKSPYLSTVLPLPLLSSTSSSCSSFLKPCFLSLLSSSLPQQRPAYLGPHPSTPLLPTISILARSLVPHPVLSNDATITSLSAPVSSKQILFPLLLGYSFSNQLHFCADMPCCPSQIATARSCLILEV